MVCGIYIYMFYCSGTTLYKIEQLESIDILLQLIQGKPLLDMGDKGERIKGRQASDLNIFSLFYNILSLNGLGDHSLLLLMTYPAFLYDSSNQNHILMASL